LTSPAIATDCLAAPELATSPADRDCASRDFGRERVSRAAEGLPEAKQNTGQSRAGRRNRHGGGRLVRRLHRRQPFRAIEARTGKQLRVTKLDRRANANPITYQGKDGKQYVAIVTSDSLVAFTLP
jgi:hypothetical protein